ncbi:MAG: hypothetical protein F6J95_000750 [Leptolyngbya sp. SIO1E4]|nr:hypothetical protein [Leptolyngbya sp. SIO1E4]
MSKWLKYSLSALALLSVTVTSCNVPSSSDNNLSKSTIEATATDHEVPFREAVNSAMAAGEATQTAKTPEEWDNVATLWTNAIEFMEAVPESNDNYQVAQQKIFEYQPNLSYALSNSSSKDEIYTLLNTAGTSKTYQCARLANVANRTSGMLSKFEENFYISAATLSQKIENGTFESVKAITEQQLVAIYGVATDMDGLVLELEGIQVSDNQILTYRDRYTKIVEELSNLLRQVGDTMALTSSIETETDLWKALSDSSSQMSPAVEKITNLSKQQMTMINELNSYCSAGE